MLQMQFVTVWKSVQNVMFYLHSNINKQKKQIIVQNFSI